MAIAYFRRAARDNVRHAEIFFDPQTQSPLDDGVSAAEMEYSPASALIRLVDDNGHETSLSYDTMGRRSLLTDAACNTIRYSYDANSNLIAITEVEKSDRGSPDQSFITTREYDNLDRLSRSTDSSGNTTRYAYDSRNHLAARTDALGNVGQSDPALEFNPVEARQTDMEHLPQVVWAVQPIRPDSAARIRV